MKSITVCRAQRQRPPIQDADQITRNAGGTKQASKLLALSLRCSSHRCQGGTQEHESARVHVFAIAWKRFRDFNAGRR